MFAVSLLFLSVPNSRGRTVKAKIVSESALLTNRYIYVKFYR